MFKKLHIIKIGAFAWYSIKIRVIFWVTHLRVAITSQNVKTKPRARLLGIRRAAVLAAGTC